MRIPATGFEMSSTLSHMLFGESTGAIAAKPGAFEAEFLSEYRSVGSLGYGVEIMPTIFISTYAVVLLYSVLDTVCNNHLTSRQ